MQSIPQIRRGEKNKLHPPSQIKKICRYKKRKKRGERKKMTEAEVL